MKTAVTTSTTSLTKRPDFYRATKDGKHVGNIIPAGFIFNAHAFDPRDDRKFNRLDRAKTWIAEKTGADSIRPEKHEHKTTREEKAREKMEKIILNLAVSEFDLQQIRNLKEVVRRYFSTAVSYLTFCEFLKYTNNEQVTVKHAWEMFEKKQGNLFWGHVAEEKLEIFDDYIRAIMKGLYGSARRRAGNHSTAIIPLGLAG